MEFSQNALNNLYEKIIEIKSKRKTFQPKTKEAQIYKKRFLNYINDDLNMPRALALMWDLIKDRKILDKEKYNILLDFDKIFGLKLNKIKEIKVPIKIKKLIKERLECRKQKNWKKADKIRKEIEKSGYQIEDAEKGSVIKKLRD